ncbi:YwmB family TATA-box binding protein [Desulfosporosinus sp. PR]|uniref:YwmB family TATA-box binding protein n=1 Tax=Candidatus Desulfosporosinus nitrosoreducens TaxID=3401928 RepID=UPI0027F9BC64|nr:YwmB family TATA-box binding protein [Desulfosporosinus sp. PR]MDQ7093036.1 YwmB family TATA-box binding protein [Desulfosporosinus sp. PR]
MLTSTIQRSLGGKQKIIVIALAFFMAISFKPNFLMPADSTTSGQQKVSAIPLLLNSQQVASQKATVRLIIWFDDLKGGLVKLPNPPLKNWKWESKELYAGNGKRAMTISGESILNKNEEQQLYTWYTIMARSIAKEGGRVYLDERIPESLDISAYLSHLKAQPIEWALSDNLVSIAACERQINPSVKVGNDRINLQLLSRGESSTGQTVLAMPVLLEEF